MDKQPVVIVGGGLAGICCARELQARGVDFVLVDGAERLGGRVRTEELDGFRLDAGFQVLLTSYPEAQRSLDFGQLQLGRFQPGALIRYQGRLVRFSDPWRQPLRGFSSLFAAVATLADKARVALLRARVCRGTADDLLRGDDVSTRERLWKLGFSSRIVDSFFQPFLRGVFLERDLATSAKKFEYLFRMFAQGDATLPAGGMARIPEQLAAAVPPERLRLGSRVRRVEASRVWLESGALIDAARIVVACDPWNAATLLNESPPPAGNPTAVLYYAADRPPVDEPVLVLNGEGSGPVNSLCVPSLVAKGYAPSGSHLVSVTLADRNDADDEPAVRSQLREWFGNAAIAWRHLSTISVANALPRQLTLPAGLPQTHAVVRPDGVIVCGDYLDVASIQGAMRSGRAAAELAAA